MTAETAHTGDAADCAACKAAGTLADRRLAELAKRFAAHRGTIRETTIRETKGTENG